MDGPGNADFGAQAVIDSLVARLQHVRGITAIVLGGSRARGTHNATSDIDLGLYYRDADALDLTALQQVAGEVDDDKRAGTVTPIGGWGTWINGGGWLTVQSIPVDLLYRDAAKVAAYIEQCRQGQVEIWYQPGHPHGFVTAIYLAEIALCQPRWDPEGVVSALKQQVTPYPARLRQALIQKFLWEARFSWEIAHKGILRHDGAYVAGCWYRSISCLLQTLFALNEHYWMNEKGAVALATTFPLTPSQLAARTAGIFAALSSEGVQFQQGQQALEALIAEVEHLVQKNQR